MASARFPIPQGTLDMLILQVLSLERAGHQQLAREKAGWDQLTAAVRLIFNEGA